MKAHQHHLRPDLAVPTSNNDASHHLVTVIVAQTLEQSCRCLDQRLFSNLHPKHTHVIRTEVLLSEHGCN